MKPTRFLLPIALLGFTSAQGQVVFTTTTQTYSQDFNNLASSGSSAAWTNNVTLPGWYAGIRASGNTYIDPTSYTVRTLTAGQAGVGNSPGLQDTALSGSTSTDRSLGIQPSYSSSEPDNGTPMAFAVRLTNNTSFTITSLNLGFTGEQWTQGYTATGSIHESLLFGYAIDVSALNSDAFTLVDSFKFTDPIASQSATDTSTALDGNSAANRQVLSGVLTIDGGWAPGTDLWLRWSNADPVASSGQRASFLSVDDVSLSIASYTTAAVPEPATWLLLLGALPVAALVRRRR